MEPKRLYRDTSHKVLGGVCSGLGNYFDLDPLLFRLIFIVGVLVAGSGILLYLILWIAMPEQKIFPSSFANAASESNSASEKPGASSSSPEADTFPPKDSVPPVQRRKGSLTGGLVLITLGIIFLVDEFFPHIGFGDLWPAILVVIGIGLLVTGMTGKNQSAKS